MSTQTLNLTPEVYQYFQSHAFREPPVLAQLRAATLKQFPDSVQMQISPEQGQFLQFMIKAIGARRVLEIGTFTGYSALWMALGLPANGQLITCDVNATATEIAKDFWRQAGVNNQIALKLAPAEETLQKLLNSNDNNFDFAFIDADKVSYDVYFEQCIHLVRVGGIIAIDNTLQGGRVADRENQNPNVTALRQLNDKLLHDPRILLSMLPISDGLSLIYKL